jgi:hypothetical protein
MKKGPVQMSEKEEEEGFKRKPVTERGRISRRLLSGLTNDAAAHYHYHHHINSLLLLVTAFFSLSLASLT